jgi:hypothetical protein
MRLTPLAFTFTAILAGCCQKPIDPAPQVNLQAALLDIKKSFQNAEADKSSEKVGVIPAEITVTLEIEATQTKKGEVSILLARPSTSSTVGPSYSEENVGRKANTITIKFINPLTLTSDTLATKLDEKKLRTLLDNGTKTPLKDPSKTIDR